MWDVHGQPFVDSSAMTYVGQPRCYEFFLEHRKCWANADRAEDCLPQRKDFIECVYLAKEHRRTKDVADHAAKLREKRQKQDRGRGGQIPSLNLVSAVDIPDEPTDYPDKHYPDDAQSRGLGWRGAGKMRPWSSEKAKEDKTPEEKSAKDKDETAAKPPEQKSADPVKE